MSPLCGRVSCERLTPHEAAHAAHLSGHVTAGGAEVCCLLFNEELLLAPSTSTSFMRCSRFVRGCLPDIAALSPSPSAAENPSLFGHTSEGLPLLS